MTSFNDKPWAERIQRLQSLASVATGRYGLSDSIIGYGGGADDCKLFFVDLPKARFTLRIYHPKYSLEQIRSEIHWLRSLKQQANLIVPEPIAGENGAFVQSVTIAEIPEPRYCVLSHWLDGIPFKEIPHEKRTPKMLQNLGQMTARMHMHSEGFIPPPWFRIPRRGTKALINCINRLRVQGNTDNLETLLSAGNRFLRLLEELGEGRDVFGIIHSDLHETNLLFWGDEPRPIDFTLLGWGYYLSDIIKIRDYKLTEEHYALYLIGYQQVRPIPAHIEEYIQIFRDARFVVDNWF